MASKKVKEVNAEETVEEVKENLLSLSYIREQLDKMGIQY